MSYERTIFSTWNITTAQDKTVKQPRKLNEAQTRLMNSDNVVYDSNQACQSSFAKIFSYQGPRSMIKLGIVYTLGDLFSIHSDKENIQTCYSLFAHN